jgi:hypothetical protein
MRLTVNFRQCLCLIPAVLSLPLVAPGAANDAVWYHCAGSARLTGNTNLVTLNKVLSLPSAAAVQKLALARVSAMVAGGFALGTNAAPLLEPLLSDVLEKESVGSFDGGATNPLNFVLALPLDATRAQLWSDNLDKAFGAPGEKFTVETFEGRRWKTGASDSFWIVRARDWLLAGRGDEFLPLQTEYLQQLNQQRRLVPTLQGNWLEADLDWTRPTACAPEWARLLKPARLKISVAAEQDNLRLAVRVIYPEAVPWKSAPWQMPTNLFSSPLISFTAGQHVAAFLNPSPAFSALDGDPLTNQFCAWAMSEFPFLTYMAWPVVNATNALEKLSTEASAAFSSELKEFNGTELHWQANERRLLLSNLRIILPSVQAVHEKDGEFLLLDLFPLPPAKKTAPDQVWQQINGRTNLVYYDWESTGPRMQQWQMLGRMLLIRSRAPTRYIMKARLLEEKWLGELAPLAGNSVTEITRVAPNELSVVRHAPLALTGIEMFLLSDWLSTVGAPAINSRPPPH